MTYSRQQRDRAVGLYIRYECCAADAIHELGYPSKEALRMWYRERLEEERTGVPVFCQVPASKIVMLFSAGCAAGFPQDGHPCGSPAACVLFWLVYLVMRAFRLR